MAGTVVITGGKGFVGKYLVKELREAGWQTEVFDLPEVDITKVDSYKDKLEEIKPAWVAHLAAISSVAKSYDEPELTRRVNVEATVDLLEAAKVASPKTKFLVVSTADVYGNVMVSPPPVRRAGLFELDLGECQPESPYAKSKWEMEKIIVERFIDKVIRARPFPHIGPGQALGFVASDFAQQIAEIEAGRQKPVMRVGNLEAKRDFTDVRDVARAYRLLLEKGKLSEVYHVASGAAISIRELLDKMLALSDKEILVEQAESKLRPSDIVALVGDATKLKKATGWQPEIPLEQTLKDILDYWRGRVTS